MATVYILYSPSADMYYIGRSKDLDQRIHYHNIKEFGESFTAKYDDWQLYYSIEDISPGTATKIEAHIKRMKSRKYLENLKNYPEMVEKLIARYS